jgi:asparagine synthase (glutamine-hydrolysing)
MFVCALQPRGEALSRADVFGYIARLDRRPDQDVHSVVSGPFAAFATASPGDMRPRLARWRQLVAVGDVRLDNRAEIARLAGVSLADVESDLQLAVAALDAVGEGCIRQLLGDFGFVVWDPGAQKLLAIRDAFGVKPLYQRSTGELALFGSAVAPLQHEEAYDLDYIQAQLSGFQLPVTATVWQGVTSVQPGAVVRFRGTVRTEERFWRAEEFMPADEADEGAACEQFRSLLEDGVRTRMEGSGEVWCYLSGGLDSSSVTGLARTLGARGGRLGGTVTFVDSMGEGDERQYSDAVVQKYQLRNEQVRDYWPWQDDGMPPPVTDHPAAMYPYFARERRVVDIVRGAGGRVLLSGIGADHYLNGSLDYITDLASRRRIRAALDEVTRWSVASRQSFWTLSRRFLVDPFLPTAFRHGPAGPTPPAWLSPGLGGRLAGSSGSRIGGHRFGSAIASALGTLPPWFERTMLGDQVEVRYPFLHRPLVELSLQLPANHRIRPGERKRILRRAMQDVLPDNVRARTSKGGIDARILWSLHREKRRLDAMLKDPILAQLGCIEPAVLRDAVEQARRGVPVHNVHLFCTLSMETWLSVRSGRWQPSVLTEASAA